MLFEGIDLTQEQQEKIRTIREESQSQNRTWREENGDKIDAARTEIEEARKALAEAEKKMAELMATAPGSPEKTGDQIMAVLTDEQKVKYEENLERFRQMRAERGQGGFGPPRDGEAGPPRGPRDGEGGPPRGPRDGEGGQFRGPRDGEGGPPRERQRDGGDRPPAPDA